MANRILVVEDDTAISELICMNLEVTGYEVVPVLDGNEVEGTLEKEENFDLALLDIMLPGKDGFELLGVMKSQPSFGARHRQARRGMLMLPCV